VLYLAGARWGLAYAGGSLLALLAGAYLLLSPPAKARRQQLKDFDAKLAALRKRMLQGAQVVTVKHQKRQQAFDVNMTELRATLKRYCSEGDEITQVLREQTGEHKNNFLRGHMLRDHIAEISGLTASMIPMLESYGVESALDVHKLGVYGVPVIGPELALEMLQWREHVEQRFKFKPEHGITAADMERAKQAATERFKISQARKILIGARHLDSLAMVGKAALRRSARDFETLSSKWKAIAREKGSYEQNRTQLERTLNSSKETLIGATVGILVVGGLVTLIFG